MEELTSLLAKRVGISEKQARTAVETVVEFLKARLPAPLSGFLDTLLGQGGTLDQAGDILGGLGGLLGGLGIGVPGSAQPAKPAPKKPAARPAPKKPAAKPAPKKPAAKPAPGKPASKPTGPPSKKPSSGK